MLPTLTRCGALLRHLADVLLHLQGGQGWLSRSLLLIAVSTVATLEPLVVERRSSFELLAWTLARVIEAGLGRVQR